MMFSSLPLDFLLEMLGKNEPNLPRMMVKNRDFPMVWSVKNHLKEIQVLEKKWVKLLWKHGKTGWASNVLKGNLVKLTQTTNSNNA